MAGGVAKVILGVDSLAGKKETSLGVLVEKGEVGEASKTERCCLLPSDGERMAPQALGSM